MLPELPSAGAPLQNGEGAGIFVPADLPAGPAAATAAAEPDAATPPMPLTKPVEQAERPQIAVGTAQDRAVLKAPMLASPIREAVDEPTPSAVAVAASRPVAPIVRGQPEIRPTEALDRPLETVVRPAQEPLVQRTMAASRQAPDQQRAVSPALVPVIAAPPTNPLASSAIPVPPASAPAAPSAFRRAAHVEPMAAAALLSLADAVQPHAVSAAADVRQGPLDTRRQEWVGKMVEHIEALRDAAPVRETRLSLAPEALGNVEVSIRHEGDRVHVHFTTETTAARQLIADAQPRLTELAEARGLKLGQTSFESGTAGQSPHRESRSNPAPQQSRAPLPANSESAVGSTDDERIA
jgi:flagellar hook-length control protein FliK